MSRESLIDLVGSGAARGALRGLVREFLASEVVEAPREDQSPVIAAIGTIAAVALENPLLRGPLLAAGLAPSGYLELADPRALFEDRSWTLALVISPFKGAVASRCDRLSPAAAATGVLDTVVRAGDRTIGYNTNSYAAVGALRYLLGGDLPARVLLAGTGGTACSVGFGLTRSFPGVELGVIGKSPGRAAILIERLGAGSIVADPASFAADVVVHATTVGERDDAVPLAFDLEGTMRPGVRFLDLTNRLSALQRSAIAAGCVTMSGILMQLITNILRIVLVTDEADTSG